MAEAEKARDGRFMRQALELARQAAERAKSRWAP